MSIYRSIYIYTYVYIYIYVLMFWIGRYQGKRGRTNTPLPPRHAVHKKHVYLGYLCRPFGVALGRRSVDSSSGRLWGLAMMYPKRHCGLLGTTQFLKAHVYTLQLHGAFGVNPSRHQRLSGPMSCHQEF